MNGYEIDWIDRVEDHGFRLLRIDGGVQTPLMVGTPEILDPPSEWVVELTPDEIIFSAGGAEVFRFADSTYREGFVGVWSWSNNTQILVDNVDIEYEPTPISACLTAVPLRGGAPLMVDFDASCSLSTTAITSYEWDFGDGQSGSGETVSHVYDFADTYVATLTIMNANGDSDTASVTVEVIEIVDAFVDNFDRADGPVDGWTVYAGVWDLIDEQLLTTSGGQEYWLWAGDVGRHAGIMFASSGATWRWDQSGYTIDWIDRAEDHGFRFIRWDAGTPVTLVNGTPEIADPPVEWRVVVSGELMAIRSSRCRTPRTAAAPSASGRTPTARCSPSTTWRSRSGRTSSSDRASR
jgi:PKD repeat protein